MPCSEEKLIACTDNEAEKILKHCVETNITSDAGYKKQHSILQRDLLQILFRCRCPPSMTLGDYYLGLLTETGATIIESHLAECPYCLAELKELSQYLLD